MKLQGEVSPAGRLFVATSPDMFVR